MHTVLRRYVVLVCLLATTIALGACGQWTPPSPSAPSQFRDTPSNGARISGVLNGGNAVNAMLASGTSNLTVTILGTTLSSSVSVSGKFVLSGVPAGPVTLSITGPGVNATVNISGGVEDREIVDISIKVEGNFARIESSIRIHEDDEVEIEGPITAVSGSCPNLTVVIQGTAFKLTTSTAGACGDIKIGIKIKIKGTKSGNVIVVIKVEMDDDDDDDDDDDHDDDDDDK